MSDEAAVDRIFAALADRTRRDIVTRVLRDEASVSALALHYDMSFAAVQKHVAVLERAALVSKRRRGREQLVRGEVETLRVAGQLLDQLEDLWRGRLDRMDRLLAAEASSHAHPDDGHPDATDSDPDHSDPEREAQP